MEPSNQAWFVGFIPRERRYWWDVFCRKYRHVTVFALQRNSQPLLVNWDASGLMIAPVDGAVIDALVVHIFHQGGVILKANRQGGTFSQPYHPFASCVSIAKQILRIKSWAVTPDQLHCACLKAGFSRSFTGTEQEVARERLDPETKERPGAGPDAGRGESQGRTRDGGSGSLPG